MLASVVLAAGCGGSSSGSSETTPGDHGGHHDRRRERPAHEGAVGGAQESRTAFRKALANANATTTKCLHGAKSADDFQNIPKTQACVGDVFTQLQQAAGDSLDVLQGFDGTVSGACATALTS